MSSVIIFKNDLGGVSVIHPSPEALEVYTIKQIADKDVPAGKNYKIIDLIDLPSDRTFRNAWTIDESQLTDGVGNTTNLFEVV